MDLLAAYDSDLDASSSDGISAAAEYERPAGHGTTAQQRLAESVDQEHARHIIKARLNTM
jgi:hypothetical protein